MIQQKNESAAAFPVGRRLRVNRRGFLNAALAAGATAVAARQLAADESPDRGAIGASSLKIKDEYKPGDRVPVSGIYDVTHDRLDGDDHALPHQVTAIAGKVFPPCRWCGREVRFRLHHAAFHVDADVHFRG